MPTASRTDARAAVLDAAAALFDTRGFAGVSIADLTAASGVSNGSIYHHFGAKEGVLAALVVDALGEYQRGLLAALDADADDPAAAIHAAVAFELAWFEAHPRAARLVIAHRDRVAAGATSGERLRAINRPFTRRVRAWLARGQDAGAIPRAVDLTLLHAIAFAPARELGSLWLAGRVKGRPSARAAALGDAAWAGLQTIGDQP